MKLTTALHQVPFFAHFNSQRLEVLATRGTVSEVAPATRIFREGDLSTSMYLILEGQVRVVRETADSISELKTLTEGEIFGEMGLFDRLPRSATAITATPCTLFNIDSESFLELLVGADAQSILNIFSVLTERIRGTNEKYIQEEIENRTMAASMEIERLRGLTQMVAGVAHELNTPLGVIVTAASIVEKFLNMPDLQEVVQTKKLKIGLDDAKEAIGLMQRQVQRAHRLTQDFKKVSVSQLSDVKEKFSIIDGINEAIFVFIYQSRRTNIHIDLVDRLPADNKTWYGFRGYLSQVLLNLFSNIERYAYDKAGGNITVTIEADGNDYVLTVQDYGKGISAEALPKVFEPFYTTGRSMGGTGLGLAIVHTITTQALKGTIRMESQVGQGTTVRVTVPQSVPD